uniref:Kinesin-like protein n=1 Tax=Pundamilia nyererei TaxID=303518 RepID=A0A3B4GLZ0_9CICH
MATRVAVSDGGNKKTSRVRVAVRLRPYMNKEDEKSEGPCVRGLDSQNLEIINWRNATETVKYFDVFHGEQTTQQEVFLSSVKPILPHILNGQNASVFAYGPTGAKTHTMLGSSEQPGVIPRAVREVFKLVKAKDASDGWDYSIGMSYLEIYNEKVLDLLSPNSQDLPIREDKDKNILIPGLTHMNISKFADFDKHFVPATLNRTTASTKLNQRSSRSHAILLIKQVVRTQQQLPHRQQTGKLYLVDLAGSEDNRRTGNQGIRLKESGAINLSLFTLSKVVDSLNSGTSVRVPYRDSKLTRLLQDSLGGSAHSVMITNIAPEYKYYFDTFSALNFAAKSKLIVNKPFTRETVAVVPSSDQSLMDRLIALEKRTMSSQDKERLAMLKRLKEKQRELESKAMLFSQLAGEKSITGQESDFENKTTALRRKQSDATKPNKQQAVVQPLQSPGGKENNTKSAWESQLDQSMVDQSKQKILQILNTGCLKELKSLQQIGDKKAKLILGWREIHGHFLQVEDLIQVEGMTEKRFSSFMK